MRIAFYAPLKAPDHPVPSGDRRMARLLVEALRMAGHAVEVASRLRTYAPDESAAAQERIRDASVAEADDLLRGFEREASRCPDLWFTYHLYYRAPDWIGPLIAKALSVPYVVAEASYATKRAGGPWDLNHRGVEQALQQASVVFSLARRDTPALAKVPDLKADIVPLPPFVETGGHRGTTSADTPLRSTDHDPPVLLAVGMMRARAKLESYRLLGAALERISDRPWLLAIAGDGPARAEIEQMFSGFGSGRIRWLGQQTTAQLDALYHAADLLVWPGFDEAFGMVYLEAQAAGLPVVAMDHGGVGDVVREGTSGRLVKPGDVSAYARAIGDLLDAPADRARLGQSARAFIERERSLAGASARIDKVLAAITGRSGGESACE